MANAPLNFPLFFAFGAGKPTITAGGDIDSMITAGAKGVRMSIPWDTGDPGFTGNYTDTNAYDAIIQYCNSRNFLVILQVAIGATFGGTSDASHLPGQCYNHNANTDGSPGNTGPINVPRLLSSYAVAVGTRYAPGSPHGHVLAIEILNEPNHGKADTGVINGITCSGVGADGKGAAYLEYLARCYPALHAAGVTMISGGLGGVGGSGEGDISGFTFLQQIYAANITINGTTYRGTDGLWDHFNYHPYINPRDTATNDLARPANQQSGWATMVNKIAPLLAANGHLAGKGIWITEWGNPTNDPNVNTASTNVADMIAQWNTYPWGGGGGSPACLFCFQDGGAGEAKGKLWGVVDHSYAPKQPYYDTFKNASLNGLPSGNQPTVTALSPAHGAAGGGTSVTITGTKFSAATAVSFGSVAATSFVVNSATSITAVAPAGTGTVDVRVTNAAGISAAAPPGDAYTYDGTTLLPTVSSVSPASENGIAGGNSITIRGANFTGALGVKIGGTACTSVVVVNASTITCTTPAKALGSYHTIVRNSAGSSTPVTADFYAYTSGTVGAGGIGLCAPNTTAAAAGIAAVWAAAGNTNPPLVRIAAGWNNIQTFPANVTNPNNAAYKPPGQYDTFTWGALDAVIDAHEAAGNKVLLIFGVDVANGLGSGHQYPNRDANNGYRDYANFVYTGIARYCGSTGRHGGGTVIAAELGNEMNPPQGVGWTPYSATNYSAMYLCAGKAVKDGTLLGRADRATFDSDDVQLITAGCAPANPGDPGATDRWVQAMITAGCGPYIDGAASHPYGLQCPPGKNASWNQRRNVLPQLRTVLDNAGLTDVGIWLTEDGCFTRRNGTPDNTGDIDNCGTYGTGSGDASHEIQEQVAAVRIVELFGSATTTIAAGSNGVNTSSFNGAGTLHVGDTTHFAAYETVYVPTNGTIAAITFTGSTSTTLTGCKTISGGGVMSTGATVYLGWFWAWKTILKLVWLTYYEYIDTGTDWSNHAGLYDANGTVKPNVHDAFVAALGSGPTRGAPTCAITVPTTDPTHVHPVSGQLIFIAGATDAVDDQSDLVVKLYRDGGSTLVGPMTFSADGFFYVMQTPTALADGNYSFVAKTTNTAGLTTASAAVAVTIANGTTPGIAVISSVTNDADGTSSGPAAGGTAITITGSKFTGATAVTVGGTAMTSFTVVSSNTITAVTPAKAAGTYNVKVTNAAGTSDVVAGDQFTYVSSSPTGAPTVTLVSPDSGAAAGADQTVAIGGTNFVGVVVNGVKFGGIACPIAAVTSPTTITAVPPVPAGPGPVDVTVENASGVSGRGPADVYTYGTVQTNVAPTVAIVSITGSDGVVHSLPGTYIEKGVVTVEITVSDDHDTAILPSLYAGSVDDDNLLGVGTPKPGAPGHYTVTFDHDGQPNGVEALVATATDSGGLTGTSP